jgi:polyhydroxyalkanoate synthesis regulator phasin
MAAGDPWKRYLDAGLAFTQMTRDRAEKVVKEFVRAGEVQREQAQERVEELLDRSRKNTEQLAAVVRGEITKQLSALGLATKEDIARLEAKIKAATKPAPPKKAGASKATAAKKTS